MDIDLRFVHSLMDEWINGLMELWMNGLADAWINGVMDYCNAHSRFMYVRTPLRIDGCPAPRAPWQLL